MAGMIAKPRANYGVYGSWTAYALFAAMAVLTLLLVSFTVFLRILFIVAFATSVALLTLLLLIPQIFYARRRIRIVHEVITAGKIGADDHILDLGTGRGFLAIEIAKAVKGCSTVGIDVWSMPAKGEIHKGFVLGNTKENAERNAQLEGVSDNVKFRRADARELPFESESFDVVISSFVMHQIVYSAGGHRVFEETYRVLKPEGRLVIVDAFISGGTTQKLLESGFKEMQVKRIRNLGPFSFFLRMLYGTK